MSRRNPDAPISSATNMYPHEQDEFFGKPDPNNQRALPFILAGFGFIALLWIVAFVFL